MLINKYIKQVYILATQKNLFPSPLEILREKIPFFCGHKAYIKQGVQNEDIILFSLLFFPFSAFSLYSIPSKFSSVFYFYQKSPSP